MPAKIIDGKAIAREVRNKVRQEVTRLREQGVEPGLAVILVGEDPASQVYVRNKARACEEVGIRSQVHRLPQEVSEEEVLILIDRLNQDATVHGILVQLPLPGHIHREQVLERIHPHKDVDGFHPHNQGRLFADQEGLVPCTPRGILHLLEAIGVQPEGREAVVVGRSLIVGKPTSMLLLRRHATVTLCHSRTRDLATHCRRADILVVAMGRPRAITRDMVKPGAVVMDVGIHRLPEGGLVGDVDFEGVREVASWITPVPGGVGPMTIAMLLENTLQAARLQSGIL